MLRLVGGTQERFDCLQLNATNCLNTIGDGSAFTIPQQRLHCPENQDQQHQLG